MILYYLKNIAWKIRSSLFTIGLCFFLSSGCMSSINKKTNANLCEYERPIYSDNEKIEDRIRLLEHDLSVLLGYPDDEALLISRKALAGSKALSMKYGAFRPAWFHNTLINLGIKERGLCCHWTQDLLKLLDELELKKFDLFWGVSGLGTYREHSSVVVVRKGQDFYSGIVLDPWRYAGDLFWSKVKADRYDWQRHPDDDGTVIIGCNGFRSKKEAMEKKE